MGLFVCAAGLLALGDGPLSFPFLREVPVMSLRFEGGGELKPPSKNYLVLVNGAGTYCLAFAAASGAVSVIGNVQQQGVRVSFDTAKNAVVFSSNKC